MTGVVPYHELDSPAPIAIAVSKLGMRWLGIIVDLGALAGLTSVILINLMGQPFNGVVSFANFCINYNLIQYFSEITSFFSDGLFFQSTSKIHPKFKTPYITTAITGIVCAIASALLPIDVLAELTSVGTLLAFFIVNIGVLFSISFTRSRCLY